MPADHPDVSVTFQDGEVTTMIRALLEYRNSLIYLQGRGDLGAVIDDELVRTDRMRERLTISRDIAKGNGARA